MISEEILQQYADGLDLKEASTKRAKNTAKNPAFAPIYETELNNIAKARAALQEIREQQKALATEKQK